MHIPSCLDPDNLPNGWRPEEAIDLLPAFRLKYPGWIRDSMLSLELRVDAFFDHERHHWSLRYREVDAGGVALQPIWLPLAPITEENDNYGFEDHSPSDYPADLIMHLLHVRRCRQLARSLPLFSLAAEELIQQFGEAMDQDDATVDAARSHQKRADFCESLARGFSRTTADGLLEQCSKKVAAELKRIEVWREAAEILQGDGHMLRQMTVDDIERRASSALKALSLNQRLALWLAMETDGNSESVREMASEWDADRLARFDPLTTRNFGMPDCAREVAGVVESALVNLNLSPESTGADDEVDGADSPATAEHDCAADLALISRIAAGEHPDMLEPELADQIEAAALRYPDDAVMQAAVEKAVNAYAAAAMAATEGLT